jgi:hypothetical protein
MICHSLATDYQKPILERLDLILEGEETSQIFFDCMNFALETKLPGWDSVWKILVERFCQGQVLMSKIPDEVKEWILDFLAVLSENRRVVLTKNINLMG